MHKLKIPSTVPLFGHTKTLHTLIGMASIALVDAAPYSGKVARMSHEGR